MKFLVLLVLMGARLCVGAEAKWPKVKFRDGSVMENVRIERVVGIRVYFVFGNGNKHSCYWDEFVEPQKSVVLRMKEAWEAEAPARLEEARRKRELAKSLPTKAEKDALSARIAGGVTAKTWILWVKGVRYEVGHVESETPVSLKVVHKSGIATLLLADLNAEDQSYFGYEPALAERWHALGAAEKAREQVAWFERRRIKRQVDLKTKDRE
jgi:hypothetical protein